MSPTLRIIIFVGGAILLIALLAILGILPGGKKSAPAPASLEAWGLEDEEAWRNIIEEFKKENQHLSVNYRKFAADTYEETLVNRLAEGRGPDLFLLKNSWITKHRDKIIPLSRQWSDVSIRDFQNTFVDIASSDLISAEGLVLGMPLFIDTPALIYNKDIFNSSGIAQPPKTWEDLAEVSKKLTVLTPAGDVEQSGVALGHFHNIARGLEILSSIILQEGDEIINRTTHDIKLGQGARGALSLYTSFGQPRSSNFTWTRNEPNSLDAFAEGKTAMILGFPDDAMRLRAKNPHLNLAISSLPQPRGARTSVAYGNYFFMAVSKFSLHPQESWQFALFASGRDSQAAYLEKTGRAPSRRDVIAAGAKTPELDVFYRQSLFAKSWPIPDEKTANRLFREAVGSVVDGGTSVNDALARLQEQLQLIIP